MIPLLAEQSVQRKMHFAASKLLGAYEFYYSAGFLYKISGLELPEKLPGYTEVTGALREKGAPAGEKGGYLYRELLNFPEDGLGSSEDEDILAELFADGYADGATYDK